jgi:hypothetical protein
MSDPWLRCVVARDPDGWNSTRTDWRCPAIRSLAIRPIRTAAAQWELDGPRITGPTTSLKMLGGGDPFWGWGITFRTFGERTIAGRYEPEIGLARY